MLSQVAKELEVWGSSGATSLSGKNAQNRQSTAQNNKRNKSDGSHSSRTKISNLSQPHLKENHQVTDDFPLTGDFPCEYPWEVS